MSLAQIKKEYFIKGEDNQKRPDVVFDFKRIGITKINTLSAEERDELKKFVVECKDWIDTFLDTVE